MCVFASEHLKSDLKAEYNQIVIGTNNTTICEQALENEPNLTDLISHSRKIEATEEATKSWI